MNNNLYPVFAYGKWGLINSEGNQIIPIIYTYSTLTINSLQKNIAENNPIVVIRDNKYGVLDINKRKEIVATIYDDIRSYADCWCVLKDGVWYVLEKGLLYEIGKYNSVNFINEEFIQLEESSYNSEFGYNKYNKELELVYSIAQKKIFIKSEVHIFYNDLAKVCINKKYGFINHKGELVIPAIYDNAGDFLEGIAFVSIDTNEYYIDTMGAQIISGSFYNSNRDIYSQEDGTFMEGTWMGLVCYTQNRFVGLKGLHDKIITSPIYDCIDMLYNNEEYLRVERNGRNGYIDRAGKIIIPCKYYDVNYYKESDCFTVSIYKESDSRQEWWEKIETAIVDVNYNYIFPMTDVYHDIHPIDKYLAWVKSNKSGSWKYGLLRNSDQEFIIPPIYDDYEISGDLFFVMKDNKWGYLDRDGNKIMEVRQDFDYSIFRDYFYGNIDGKWGWIGERDELTPPIYENEWDITFKNWKPIIKKIIKGYL